MPMKEGVQMMRHWGRCAAIGFVIVGCLWLEACGGGGGSTTTPPPVLSTPTVTVTPSPTSITTAQSVTVTVTVSGNDGTPAGTVTLSGGGYSSGATTLTNGSATITIPADSLAAGTDTLTASYTPSSASSSTYNSASGTNTVTVTTVVLATPTVTVSSSSSITTVQALTVTVTVSGTSGTPTGSVTLSSGSYSSGAMTLSGGSALITIPAGTLGLGPNTLTAAYTPDTASSAIYNGASGTGSVSVALDAPTVTVTPSPSSITEAQSVTVTVTVSGGSGAPVPAGTVTLSGGGYSTPAGGVTLTNGSVPITIAAGTLAIGTDTLTASFAPTPGSTTYTNSSGTGTVTVGLITPTVTVSPNPSSITNTQGTTVTVSVSGGSGNPTATGSVTLTSVGYNSGAVTLSGGSAQITVAAGVLAVGSDTLTATYTPDTNSSSTYNGATGTGAVTVTGPVTITSFTAAPGTIALGSSSMLTAVFSGGTGVITPGSISVSSGDAVSVTPTTTTIYTLTVTPTSGTAVTQTVTVSIQSNVTVNPSSPGIAVTDQILGMNMAIWYDFTDGGTYTPSNSPIISAYQGAGIVALRWPGGSDSDEYHWNGTATSNPPDGTAPAASGCEGEYLAPNTDYLSFINDLENATTNGFDVALTADYGTNPTCNGGGIPSEAADWVEYAYANGGTVSHVTVGNEVYGDWEEDMHAVQHDPTTYANAVIGSSGYYELIKNQSASTLVGVVVDADCTTSSGCTDGWDSTVLSDAKGYYDFVEFHYYPQYGDVTSDTFLVQQAAQEFTTDINTIKSELTTAGEPDTPIYVGEIGANSSNPGTQSWSITQGLYAGQILGEAMNDGISRLTWWIGVGNCLGAGNNASTLYGWQNTWGSYDVFSDASTECPGAGPVGTMSPTGQAFNLFQNIAVNGESVLTPAVTGDTTNVRAYAATHSGGTALFLFNLDENASAPVTVTLTGQSTASSVTIETYDKAIYDLSGSTTETPPDPVGTSTWAPATTSSMGSTTLPLNLTLAPWSMNVVIIQ